MFINLFIVIQAIFWADCVRSCPCNRHYKMALISGVLTGKQIVCACARVFFHSLCPACPVASSGLIVSSQSGWNTSPTPLVVYLRTEFPVFWASSPRSWSSFSRDALKLCCRRTHVCPVCVSLLARLLIITDTSGAEIPGTPQHRWHWEVPLETGQVQNCSGR